MAEHKPGRRAGGGGKDPHPHHPNVADGAGEMIEAALREGVTVADEVVEAAIAKRENGELPPGRVKALADYLRLHPPAPPSDPPPPAGGGGKNPPDPKPPLTPIPTRPEHPAGGTPAVGWLAKHKIVPRSGLGWLSGITTMPGTGALKALDGAEQHRGAPCDSMVMFQGGSNQAWSGFARCYQRGHNFQIGEETAGVVARGMVAVLTIPGIVRGSTFEDAAAGKYDSFHKAAAEAIGLQLERLPVKAQAIGLRFSRESDDAGQPFGAERDKAAGFRNFKKFHAENLNRIWRDALSHVTPFVYDTFCLTKRGFRGFAWDWGADVLDCDLYVNTPTITSPADFKTYDRFLEPFQNQAEKTNRPLAFSEWGIKVTGSGGDEGASSKRGSNFAQNDNSYPVIWYRQTFARLAKAGLLAHENCYSCSGHGMCPPTVEGTKIAGAYRFWGRGFPAT